MTRPGANEFASYYRGYVDLIPEGDVLDTLVRQRDEVATLARAVDGEKETFRYADGKWSVREVLGHIVDAERVFAYRLFSFSRGEQQELPGFDEQSYIENSGYAQRPISSIAQEFDALRHSSILLASHLDDDALARTGVANGAPVTVRALAWITAGHTAHHLRILRERYLG